MNLALTTVTDAVVGGGADDTISGMLVGASGTGTTIQGGDSVTGGAGNDTFTIFVSGDAAASRWWCCCIGVEFAVSLRCRRWCYDNRYVHNDWCDNSRYGKQ